MSEIDFPQVSVVLPVYNAQRYLAETVESILSQTFCNFELVAVDDESTDRSRDILKEYAERDPRVRVMELSHVGIVGARNAGMKVARGEYIACMDHDDVMMPERIGLQVEFFKNHSDCIAVGGAGLLIDPDGDPLIERHLPIAPDEIEAELLQGINPLIQPSVTIRREAVLSIGGYREESNFAEDYDLFLRLAEVGKLANMPDVLVKYRQHMSRASHAHYEQQNQVANAARREAFERRGLSNFVPSPPQSWHPNTLSEFHVRCTNDALDGGNIQTARKHVACLLREKPFSPRTWDLMARVHLGSVGNGCIKAIKTLLRPLKQFGSR